ncbi:hypothetical protein AB0L70_41090 [Kribbella sp. NPDC051952]|uniref:hypothetical protein n=1 Tax=Kribbella sp. NPDC051952 TaxID=3154851 RepID=UPI003416B31D
MTDLFRRTAAYTACVLLVGVPASLAQVSAAQGSGAQASDSPRPAAPSTSYRPAQSEFSLTVSPTRLAIGPADLDKVAEILVVNRGDKAVTVNVLKQNFTGGADGALIFQQQAPYSASAWVTVSPATFTVAPGAAQTVSATIKVPAAPEPGDHQVALVFLVPAGKTAANVRINRGVGAPVYITVPGPTDNTAELSDLNAPAFMMWGHTDVTAKVHNAGTVHRDFRDTSPLTIKSAGHTSAFPDFTVMRGATRDISTVWNPPLLCVCHPTVSLVNADGAVDMVTVRVIVFPLHLLGIGVVAGLAIWLGIRWWRRHYRAAVATAATQLKPIVGGGSG